jgi:DNA-binding IclR family transcriptional regulator
MVQATSIETYRDLRDRGELGPMQEKVLRVLRNYARPLTNKELSRMTGIEINSITPRVFELREMGAVVECPKRPCTISGRMAITWMPAEMGGQIPLF